MKKNILNVHCLKSDECQRVLDKCGVTGEPYLTGKQSGLFDIRKTVDKEENYNRTDMSYWLANGWLDEHVINVLGVWNEQNGYHCKRYGISLYLDSDGVVNGVRPVVCISNEQSLVGL
jgi:hypothetical protein